MRRIGKQIRDASRHTAKRRITLRGRWITWDLGMNLATILLVSIFCSSSGAVRQQAAPATKPADALATQDQGGAPPAQKPPAASQAPPPAATPAKTSAGQTSAGQDRPVAAKRPRHKKRMLPPNCDNAPAASGQAAPGSTPTPGDPPASGTAPTAGTSGTPTPAANCPPSKVIVRQGGTSEPSIQLAGGTADDQASHQRDTANQMLGSTEANLKKIAGRQLTPNQQDMVNQIRQFIDQSKTASNAGDLDRARTLAWKAQLLSEELVKPEKQ